MSNATFVQSINVTITYETGTDGSINSTIETLAPATGVAAGSLPPQLSVSLVYYGNTG